MMDTFRYPDLILNLVNNKYYLPTLRQKTDTLNYYVANFGINEIYSKLFQYTTNLLTDNMGNECIRSIIRIDSNPIKYEYKTIAIINGEYKDPIERMPMLM
jgi:hypothetical protein